MCVRQNFLVKQIDHSLFYSHSRSILSTILLSAKQFKRPAIIIANNQSCCFLQSLLSLDPFESSEVTFFIVPLPLSFMSLLVSIPLFLSTGVSRIVPSGKEKISHVSVTKNFSCWPKTKEMRRRPESPGNWYRKLTGRVSTSDWLIFCAHRASSMERLGEESAIEPLCLLIALFRGRATRVSRVSASLRLHF